MLNLDLAQRIPIGTCNTSQLLRQVMSVIIRKMPFVLYDDTHDFQFMVIFSEFDFVLTKRARLDRIWELSRKENDGS